MNNNPLQQKLLDYSMRDNIIEYQQYVQAMQKIQMLHQRSQRAAIAGGLMITGFTGSGKSTVKELYAHQNERRETETGTMVPVLTVDTPSNPTVRSLVSAMLDAMGDPISHRGSTEEKTVRLYKLIKNCNVELLIIDEFQHFVDRGKINEAKIVTDWLKNVINTAKIPVVIMGLPRSQSVLENNEQLRRRFSSHFSMDPFENTPESFIEFTRVLGIIHQDLPINSVRFHEPDIAHRFLVGTYGLIDFVAKIVDGAIEYAAHRGLSKIDLDTLRQVFKETIWKTCPDQLNPFNRSADLRWLTKPGEPFDFVVTGG